jgi:hypothetical protein
MFNLLLSKKLLRAVWHAKDGAKTPAADNRYCEAFAVNMQRVSRCHAFSGAYQ